MGRKENRSKEHRKHLFSFLFLSLPKQFGPDALVGQREVGEEGRVQIRPKEGRAVSPLGLAVTTCQLRLSCLFPCLQSRRDGQGW